MPMTIMKRVRFCAGHRLYQHGGKCEFFHGHNYVAEFYVTSDHVDDVGRLVDFAELKRAFKGWIDEHWDHAFILNQADDNGIDAIGRVVPSKVYLLPYNPTAENLARYLLEQVGPQLLAELSDDPLQLQRVVIWETEDSCAQASRDDNPVAANPDWQVADADRSL